jgi:hypothetical protein
MKARVGYQELFQVIVDKCEELGLTLNVTKVDVNVYATSKSSLSVKKRYFRSKDIF